MRNPTVYHRAHLISDEALAEAQARPLTGNAALYVPGDGLYEFALRFQLVRVKHLLFLVDVQEDTATVEAEFANPELAEAELQRLLHFTGDQDYAEYV